MFDTDLLKSKLTGIIGSDIRFLEQTDSTNKVALSLAFRGAPEGTVVIADSQTGGRGRLGRSWFSPPGKNIYTSIIIRPAIDPVAGFAGDADDRGSGGRASRGILPRPDRFEMAQ